MICNALSNQKTNRIQNWFCGIGCQQGGAAKFCMHAYNSHGANGSARLCNLMVSATATGRASGAVVTALAVAYAERRMRSNLEDLIQKFQILQLL